ncbi:hypothetical protein BOTBODRAFT_179083 [Botryobasidium botryosum FD-172 SS1]|uniref:AMP-dependent synthetase/ligase domain-containing protein n=1 Tax=Botryobasidium botryosum (strain FD-172 SS1) TaxID=930990 RepID=A0A067MCU0_BOTB1|nr:hypothetical protein BOTBODRAFT_179083 [Botryobasidium botryosum FD-172 SS1]
MYRPARSQDNLTVHGSRTSWISSTGSHSLQASTIAIELSDIRTGAMIIYTPNYLPFPIPSTNLYTQLFRDHDKFDPASPAFIKNASRISLTRKEVEDLTLSLAYGVRRVLGLCMTPANTAYAPSGLAHQLKDSGAYYVFVHPTLLPVVVETLAHLGASPAEIKERVVIMALEREAEATTAEVDAGGWIQLEDLLNKGSLGREEPFDSAQAEETVTLCYSSGTTGLSKGVMTTHRNFNSQILATCISFPPVHAKRDAVIGVLPFYHIYGLAMLVLFPFSVGVPLVICPRFDLALFCSGIQKYKITAALVVPPMMLALINSPAPLTYDLSSLRIIMSGGAPLAKALGINLDKRLQSMGAKADIIQGYGLTKTSPGVTMLRAEQAMSKMGSVGELAPNMVARLVDDDGVDVKPGQPGELWRVLEQPYGDGERHHTHGWFETGDIAERDDDGCFMIVDRKKELIKYKAFQVPPADLEAVLLMHPEVGDVGVIGIESEDRTTELPRSQKGYVEAYSRMFLRVCNAYIVPKSGYASLPTQKEREKFALEIQKWIEGKVARHKYLRGGVVVIEAIPKSAAGTTLRRQLRDLAKEEVRLQSAKAKL